jgi:HTH-type transcriptional regulator/antitoxin HigA
MLHAVTDDESHARALRRIERLWDSVPGTAAGDELDALATLVDAYEKRRFPVAPPDPIEAIEARCVDLGWSRKELEPLLGSRARVSEVLSRRRPLSLAMIRRVHAVMGIPAEILIAEAWRGATARGRVLGARPRSTAEVAASKGSRGKASAATPRRELRGRAIATKAPARS